MTTIALETVKTRLARSKAEAGDGIFDDLGPCRADDPGLEISHGHALLVSSKRVASQATNVHLGNRAGLRAVPFSVLYGSEHDTGSDRTKAYYVPGCHGTELGKEGRKT